mgnify:CR=1 FL=1
MQNLDRVKSQVGVWRFLFRISNSQLQHPQVDRVLANVIKLIVDKDLAKLLGQ